MHQLKVKVLGPNGFILTLIELKSYLKFNLSKVDNLNDNSISKCDIFLFHEDVLEDKISKEAIDNLKSIKILASKNLISKNYKYDAFLKLPTSINEINSIIENSVLIKQFIKNSSIKVKNYILDKNEKKLLKDKDFIILTEKEIQLIELFLKTKVSISKKEILSKVWNYSTDADTHTVETHIYRLRKKISDKFMDEKFILNNKDGYYF
jgi:hypothetical protein